MAYDPTINIENRTMMLTIINIVECPFTREGMKRPVNINRQIRPDVFNKDIAKEGTLLFLSFMN